MSSPKVLVYDVETSPMLAFVWGLKDQNISLSQVKHDWHIIAWAAKWLGDPASKTIYRDQRNAKNIEDDRDILKDLWKLLDEADIVITQNGKNFDTPKLNARFITHGMQPPSPYRHLDTYQIIRRVAKFTSNKLEYLTDKLCTKYKKLTHKKFPGQSLWTECLKGNISAWNEMKKYNVHDVLSTEELYRKIQAWDNSIDFNVYGNSVQQACNCGCTKFIARGYAYTATGKFHRFVCKRCGRWSASRRNLLTTEHRKALGKSAGAQ
jgi:DNA polymerase elongation subunit (family B)